jgi:hypothetical protein
MTVTRTMSTGIAQAPDASTCRNLRNRDIERDCASGDDMQLSMRSKNAAQLGDPHEGESDLSKSPITEERRPTSPANSEVAPLPPANEKSEKKADVENTVTFAQS